MGCKRGVDCSALAADGAKPHRMRELCMNGAMTPPGPVVAATAVAPVAAGARHSGLVGISLRIDVYVGSRCYSEWRNCSQPWQYASQWRPAR